jgi:hypothetical protein
MADLKPVTDPDILRQLEASSSVPVPGEVTDPALLAQLNGPGPPTLLNRLAQTWPAKAVSNIYGGMKDSMNAVYSGQPVTSEQLIGPALEGASVGMTGTLPGVTAAAPAAKYLIQRGGKQIQDAIESGQVFSPEKIKEGIDTIRQALPTRRVSEDTHAALDALEEKTGPLTFKDMVQARDELMAVQANSAKSTTKNAATDLRSSTIAKHGLDDIIKETGTPEAQQFIEGNANVTGGKQAETLDKRLYRSELRSASANSGKNIGNTIRQNVASLLLSKDARGMSPEAIQQAEQVVYGSRPENFMRHWGNVLGGGGGLGQAAAIAGSGGLGYVASGGNPTITGMAAATLPLVGALLKHGANETAISHLEALSQNLRGNTPLGSVLDRGNYYGGSMPGVTASKAALIRALIAQQAQPPTQP